MTLTILAMSKSSRSELVGNRCVFDSGTIHFPDFARRGEEDSRPPMLGCLTVYA
jgi:hypothetical protein